MVTEHQLVDHTVRCIIATGREEADSILNDGTIQYYIHYNANANTDLECGGCRRYDTLKDLVSGYRNMEHDENYKISKVSAHVVIDSSYFGHFIADKYLTHSLMSEEI